MVEAYAPLTEKAVGAICRHLRTGLLPEQACALEGVKPGALDEQIAGADPKRPDWRRKIDAAQALCVKKWIGLLAKATKGAEFKIAEKMLSALDDRFRKEKKGSVGAGPQLMVLVGAGGEGMPELPVEVVQLPAAGSG